MASMCMPDTLLVFSSYFICVCIYSQTCVKRPYTLRHILAFQTGGCLMLHESSKEIFLCNFHSAISNLLDFCANVTFLLQ